MDFEYYNLEQAANRLNCPIDDVLQLLDSGRLPPYLYLYAKPLIVVEKFARSMVGRGIAAYTGLAQPPIDSLPPLIHKGNVCISNFLCLPNIKGLEAFSKVHPFKSDLFLNACKLSEWIPIDSDYLPDSGEIWAIPCPLEFPGPMRTILQAIQNQANRENVGTAAVDPTAYPEYSYSFSPAGDFKQLDLRVRHDDLLAFGKRPVSKPKAELKRSRHNSWHDLLAKIIAREPSITPRQILHLLKADCEKSFRNIDTGHVITSIDKDYIHWESPDGSPRKFKRTGLHPLVSRLKNELSA